MTARIPEKGKISQPNLGEIYGNVSRTTNIDLKTSPGKIKTSSRLVLNTKDNDSGITDMGVPVAFTSLNGNYFAFCGIGTGGTSGTGRVLRTATDDISAPFVNDTNTNTPTDVHQDYSDGVFWANGNYVAGSIDDSIRPSLFLTTFNITSKIAKSYAGGYWNPNWFGATVAGTFRSDGGVKNLCVSIKTGNLYIGDGDRLIYVPKVPYQTNLNAVLTNTAGANNSNNQNGTVDFNNYYKVIWIRATSQYLYIGLVNNYQNGKGAMKGFVAQWDEQGTAVNKLYDTNSPMALSCCVFEDVPYIIDAYGVIKKYGGTGFYEVARLPVANLNIEMPGIYNPDSNTRWVPHRGMEVVDGKININVNNYVSSGVYVDDMPSGIWEFDPNNPTQGVYHKESPCASSDDYGQQAIQTAGAILPSKRTNGTFLAGFGYYTDNETTVRKGIFHDDIATNTNKHSILTTAFLSSDKIEDVYQKVIYRFRSLKLGDKIIGKYRTSKNYNYPMIANALWVTPSELNSTDVSLANAQTGDEVEIIMGAGSTTTAHIQGPIYFDGVTYVINLDEAIGPASGGCKIKINNFIKMQEFNLLNLSNTEMAIAKNDVQVQVKTEFRVSGDFELNDITVVSSNHKPIA